MKFLSEKKVILASGSPRRLELLRRVGMEPLVIRSQFDEKQQSGETPQDYVLRNAVGKAQWVLEHEDLLNGDEDSFVISADTIVVQSGEILEKPLDRKDAYRMLATLSGVEHTVFSGVQILKRLKGRVIDRRSSCIETKVEFKDLSPHEIEAYLETEEPWDKAGSYALQGIGCFMVRSLHGSFTNVIGLPMMEVVSWLRELD